MKPVILVTGSNGQLGQELQVLAKNNTAFQFVFATREDLSIDKEEQVFDYFKKIQPAFCINCAAYTAVDKAETEKDLAFAINATGVANLAKAALEHTTKLIHISTDYVFDGAKKAPYQESDKTNPLNVYGASKCKGEELLVQHNPDSIIIRTSWVYSSFANNFVKTMLRLMQTKEAIGVINDQIGSPTYATSLANVILEIITKQTEQKESIKGIYHYSNDAVISWYDFACTIKEMSGSTCKVNAITTAEYPTPAKRSHYSVMDKTKIVKDLGIELIPWKEDLKKCLELLNVYHKPE